MSDITTDELMRYQLSEKKHQVATALYISALVAIFVGSVAGVGLSSATFEADGAIEDLFMIAPMLVWLPLVFLYFRSLRKSPMLCNAKQLILSSVTSTLCFSMCGVLLAFACRMIEIILEAEPLLTGANLHMKLGGAFAFMIVGLVFAGAGNNIASGKQHEHIREWTHALPAHPC